MIERIENDEIILERYKSEDAPCIFEAIMLSKKEIAPWLSWLTANYNLQSTKSFVQIQIKNWQENVEYAYTIKNKSGDLLGVIALHLYDKQNDVASVGYWMNTQYTGKGYCTQALKLMVNKLIKHLNLIRIEIIVAVTNYASQKVAEKAGAEFEAVLKNRILLNGLAIDANMYAFVNSSVVS